METILTIKESDLYPGMENKESSKFSERSASRAVVTDGLNQEVALLRVSRHNYYKLPGGGIDENENKEQALERELLEEIGCTAQVVEELGKIIEYRDQYKLRQISYCYIAEQYGDKNQPAFTEKEIEDGFEVIWVKDIDEAINLLISSSPDNYDGKFIVMRDLNILKIAKEKMAEGA